MKLKSNTTFENKFYTKFYKNFNLGSYVYGNVGSKWTPEYWGEGGKIFSKIQGPYQSYIPGVWGQNFEGFQNPIKKTLWGPLGPHVPVSPCS